MGVLTAIAPLDLVLLKQTILIYILRSMWVWLEPRIDFNWVEFAPSGSRRRYPARLTQNGPPSFVGIADRVQRQRPSDGRLRLSGITKTNDRQKRSH